MTELLTSALSYAARGWPVFPLSPGSKIPFKGSKGVDEATTDEAQIRAWWSQTPDANLAVAGADHLAILDVDVKTHESDRQKDKHGDRTLAGLVLKHGGIGWTLQASTTTRGYHFYFRIPPGHEVRPSVDRIGHGLDVRGKGSYVVAPPSRIGDRFYRWTDDGAAFDRPAPWLLQAMLEASRSADEPAKSRQPRWGHDTTDRARRAIQYTDQLPPSIAGAKGHNALLRAAVACVLGFELPDAIAYEVLVRFSNRCDPPWSREELEHKIRQAKKVTQWEPGYLLRENER